MAAAVAQPGASSGDPAQPLVFGASPCEVDAANAGPLSEPVAVQAVRTRTPHGILVISVASVIPSVIYLSEMYLPEPFQ